jgi:glucokinase
MPVIVVDAGGTHLRCGVADDAGRLHLYSRQRIPSFQTCSDPSTVWEMILDLIAGYVRDVESKVETGGAIAFAVPGPVVDGCLVAAPTIIGGRPESIPDIVGALTARTGRSVYLVNDVSAAAWYLGERLAAERFFVLTVSSGIGGKLFDRRHADRVLDAPDYAGEIGHIVVDATPDAAMCDCGARGHLGAISSGRGTERLARQLAGTEDARFRASTVSQMANLDAGAITNEAHLIPAALDGDSWAISVIERAARPLALVLSAITAATGLDRIIVIGGFAQGLGSVYGNILSGALGKLLDARAFAGFAEESVCVFSDNEEVCLAGAASFYRARCTQAR